MTHGIRRADAPSHWLTRTLTGPEWHPWGPAAYAFTSDAEALRHVRHAAALGVHGAEVALCPSPAASSVPPADVSHGR